MKRIGLLGGMSWESTVPYYRILNETVREELGGLHSAELILYSVDFAEVERLQHAGRWREAGQLLAEAAACLERAGCELLVICTNTMHVVADDIASRVKLPIVHIADATADAVKAAGIGTVGLLGTKFTMEQDFYRARLERHGLRVLVPPADARDVVHRVIYDELCVGRIEETSRAAYVAIIEQLVRDGAEGIILGCTEIGLLIGPEHSPVPTFDTTAIHARAAARLALGGEG